MSYDIRIGNAELRAEWPGEDGPVAEWVVEFTKRDDAPALPFDFQPHANERSPGYSAWAEFCREAGLYPLFYGDGSRFAEGAILGRHPGIVPLTPDMLDTVRASRGRWERQHPGAVPGFDYSDLFGKPEDDDGVRGRDPMLARLVWLEWWMDYALRTCERPAVYNQ